MKVLLPVDGSYHSDNALESVVNEPWPKDSTFCVMTVAEPLHSMADSVFGGFWPRWHYRRNELLMMISIKYYVKPRIN